MCKNILSLSGLPNTVFVCIIMLVCLKSLHNQQKRGDAVFTSLFVSCCSSCLWRRHEEISMTPSGEVTQLMASLFVVVLAVFVTLLWGNIYDASWRGDACCCARSVCDTPGTWRRTEMGDAASTFYDFHLGGTRDAARTFAGALVLPLCWTIMLLYSYKYHMINDNKS